MNGLYRHLGLGSHHKITTSAQFFQRMNCSPNSIHGAAYSIQEALRIISEMLITLSREMEITITIGARVYDKHMEDYFEDLRGPQDSGSDRSNHIEIVFPIIAGDLNGSKHYFYAKPIQKNDSLFVFTRRNNLLEVNKCETFLERMRNGEVAEHLEKMVSKPNFTRAHNHSDQTETTAHISHFPMDRSQASGIHARAGTTREVKAEAAVNVLLKAVRSGRSVSLHEWKEKLEKVLEILKH